MSLTFTLLVVCLTRCYRASRTNGVGVIGIMITRLLFGVATFVGAMSALRLLGLSIELIQDSFSQETRKDIPPLLREMLVLAVVLLVAFSVLMNTAPW